MKYIKEQTDKDKFAFMRTRARGIKVSPYSHTILQDEIKTLQKELHLVVGQRDSAIENSAAWQKQAERLRHEQEAKDFIARGMPTTPTVNASRTVAVNKSTPWLRVGPDTPQNVKLLLIDERAGVATTGIYSKEGPWTHWQGLPYFEDGV